MLTTHSEEKQKQLEKESMAVEQELQAQQEAHIHFVGVEFSEIVLSHGPSAALSLLDEDAREELIEAIVGRKK